METDWKKKIWWFVRNFPAVTYGLMCFAVAIIIVYSEYFNFDLVSFVPFIVIPFVPLMLIYGGLGKITGEIACIIIILGMLLLLDLITFLLSKFFIKVYGSNIFTKIIVTILTLTIWILVFLKLINSLPIDT